MFLLLILDVHSTPRESTGLGFVVFLQLSANKLKIASLTKIMTTYVFMCANINTRSKTT